MLIVYSYLMQVYGCQVLPYFYMQGYLRYQLELNKQNYLNRWQATCNILLKITHSITCVHKIKDPSLLKQVRFL